MYLDMVMKDENILRQRSPTISKVCPQLFTLLDYTKNHIILDGLSIYNSKLRLWWKCPNGHSWLDSVVNVYKRIRHENPKWVCPVCNSIGVKAPALAEEIYDKNIDPFSISFGSHEKIQWRCKKGHIWGATVNSRTEKRHAGCPVCANIKTQTISPLLLKEWHYELNVGINPYDIAENSTKKVWWKCLICNTAWQATVANRNCSAKKLGCLTGCPKCRGSQIPKFKKSVFSMAPYLKKEWSNKNILNPENISYKSNRKLWWECENGHEWEETPANRLTKNTGCPYCSGRRVCKDNCLMGKEQELCREWHPTKNELLSPEDVTQHSSKKVWWLCAACGEEWKTTVSERSNGSGCPKCWRNILLVNGTCCSSLIEALIYLKLKENNITFTHDELYPGYGKHRFDFFIPSINLYIEVTGFSTKYKRYHKYFVNIQNKKKYVENTLKANFLFIHHVVTKKDKSYIRKHTKIYNKNTKIIG